MEYTRTAESVTKGHVDKLADQVSDAVLDAARAEDPNTQAGINCAISGNAVVLMGEMASRARIDYDAVVRGVIADAGYNDSQYPFHAGGARILNLIREFPQRSDAADRATDQGIVYGYATDETSAKMPLPLVLAHRITRRLEEVREQGILPFLRPDGKSQVTVAYDEGGRSKHIRQVTVSAQHYEYIGTELVRSEVRHLLTHLLSDMPVNNDTEYAINPDPPFTFSGPVTDSGLTGRKLMVDTYGGIGRHGGGAFSGKDPTKMDRTGAYAARWIAKNIVSAGFAKRCEVSIAYIVNHARHAALDIETFGTHAVRPLALRRAVEHIFDLRTPTLLRDLRLDETKFLPLATGGHMGREDLDVAWEKTDRVEDLKQAVKDAVS